MPRPRELRRRIRAVTNTRKITRAMELVAATKMRRAQDAVLATRRYAELGWELLREIRRRQDPTSPSGLRGAGVAHHPLLVGRSPVKRSLILVVAGNRGLVGAFNQKIAAMAQRVLRAERVPAQVVTTGRVAARILRRLGANVVADFPKKDLLADPADAAPLADFLLEAFLSGEADRVRIVYADFRSVMRQEPRVRTVLPIGEPDPLLGEVGIEASSPRPEALVGSDYVFEPSPREVLEAVVPNLLSIQIYQALLETTASEHAARMVAMKNATENADELGSDLTLALNRARQQQITQELQEIVSGALA